MEEIKKMRKTKAESLEAVHTSILEKQKDNRGITLVALVEEAFMGTAARTNQRLTATTVLRLAAMTALVSVFHFIRKIWR